MRRTLAVLALLLLTAGCASKDNDGSGVATARSGPAATPSATGTDSGGGEPDLVKFSQCMRDNGLSWFPDPDGEGRLMVRPPKDVDRTKMEAAEEACKKYSPNGGNAPRLSPEDLEKARQMSQCMRENGVPNFPDPQPNGSITLKRDKVGTGPGDPTFDKAAEKCSRFMPQPRREDRK